MFYIANAVGCPLYLVGFAETIVGMSGGKTMMVDGWDLQIVGILSLILIAIICFAGLKYVVKFQLALLALLVLSILAFIIGAFIPSLHTNFSAWTSPHAKFLARLEPRRSIQKHRPEQQFWNALIRGRAPLTQSC